jgi:alpha-tubulin suppressor-like RCC1 family protein
MLWPRSANRAASSLRKAGTRGFRDGGNQTITKVVSPYAARRQQHFIRSIVTVTALGTIASALQWYSGNPLARNVHAEAPSEETEIRFEKSRPKATSKEENRDIISSQHLQVRRSWENPGLYGWGSNAGRVAAPDSDEAFIKTPRRMPFFDGVLLRDVKLDKNFGAAIDEKGDLIQWGVGYSPSSKQPARTLQGKDLVSIAVSRDRIIGLASNGTVYSIPVSKEEQEGGQKAMESSWIPFWTGRANISYRKLEPKDLSWNERITSISSGLEHVLLLTNQGRVFTAAASAQDFPSRGQLGIPGLTWATRPTGAYDQCHEILTLRGFQIVQVAAGDYHSLALDKDGRIFSFGDNSLGQLGFDYNSETSIIDVPSLMPVQKLYAGSSQVPKVTSIAAGGTNSYFTVDATRVASPTEDTEAPLARRSLGRVTADTWSCGQGIWGQLGNGRWTHVQSTPSKIPSLSGLFEYDEKQSAVIPIRLSRLSVGATHVAAVMDNVTYVQASEKSSANDTNWGADIVFFGNNEFYQLGTGRRNNVSTPVYIQPLDIVAERKVRGKEEHRFQITPKKRVIVRGRYVDLEQRVECGRGVTAVYSGI